MLLIEQDQISQLVIHKVGNKVNGGELLLSRGLVDLKGLRSTIYDFLIDPFLQERLFYALSDGIDLKLNKIWSLSSDIFAKPKTFLDNSTLIAKHLFDCSEHHMIKEGELYVVYLEDCVIGNERGDVIGIFKCESKAKFLKVFNNNNTLDIEVDEGVGITKLEKGCLIFNVAKDEGFKVCMLDGLKKSVDAKYWKEDFLGVLPLNDEFYQTENYLAITKDFIVNGLKETGAIDNTGAISYMNKTVEYFKVNDHFSEKDFASQVFEDKQMVKSFEKHKAEYARENDIPLENDFGISPLAVKKQARIFKSVLKLDKNFHVYIHGNTELIEKGYDEDSGKHFYKIYFDEEH
jgi:hypothetical protein